MNERNKNNPAVSIADLEPHSCNASSRAGKIKALDTRVSVHVHSRRFRLADPDGISAKAVLDGLVIAGVLTDDSAKEISSVSHSQEKISKKDGQQEETIITIEEV